MKKIKTLKILSLITLLAGSSYSLQGCMPANAMSQQYQQDKEILEQYRKNWLKRKQMQFYIKQLAVELREVKKAIQEINNQLAKQKEINEDFASKIYTLNKQVKKLEVRLNSLEENNKQTMEELKQLKKEIKKLLNETKDLKKKEQEQEKTKMEATK
jgi:chromosome segregation ATPase